MSGKDILLRMEQDYKKTWSAEITAKLENMGIDAKARETFKAAAQRNAIDMTPAFPAPRKTSKPHKTASGG